MWEVWAVLFSGAIGVVIGSFLTWKLMRRESTNRSRREVLKSLAKTLQDFRIAYANWYVEYLHPGDWANIDPKTDPVFRERMLAVDTGRASLRIATAYLYAHFPPQIILPLVDGIERLLAATTDDRRTDCRDVDGIAEETFELVPDLIRRYL